MQQSLIFDTKRYAINDGPGIRIVVFMKGCNLRCGWCHNPESISAVAEKLYAQSKCIGCGVCVASCLEGALTLTPQGVETSNNRCTLCGNCADRCPTRAIEMSGHRLSVAEIMEVIEKERVFFDQSGGGVTFSGGEPLLHAPLLLELLEECKKRNIHTAVDTAGNVDTHLILEVAKKCDLFLYDLKMMDSVMHKRHTHAGNERILHNLYEISKAGAQVVVRIPLIGGINDTAENIEATAKFISLLPGTPKAVNLLPYHPTALNKYAKLGKAEDFYRYQEPTAEAQERALAAFAAYGIKATVGG